MTVRQRVLLTLLLFAALCGALVAFGSLGHSPGAWDFPGAEDVAEDPDAYLGDRVVVYGRVVEQRPLRIESEVRGGHVSYTVEGVDEQVELGDELGVYGTLEPNRTVSVLGVVVFGADGIGYTYTVSALAGFWVLGRLLTGWRVDRESLTVLPRSGGWRTVLDAGQRGIDRLRRR